VMRERDAASWTGREPRRACGRVQRGCGEDTGNGAWGSLVWSSWRVGAVEGSVAEAGRSPWWVAAGSAGGNTGVRRARGDGTGNRVCGRVQCGCGVEDTGNWVWSGVLDGHRVACHSRGDRLDGRSRGDDTGNEVGVRVEYRRSGGARLCGIWSGNGGACE
jgi:hypothetical protein